MTRTLLVPALAGFLALGLVACDDTTDTSETPAGAMDTRTGQSGGTAAPTAAGTGTTGSATMGAPGATGTAPIGSATPLPPGTGTATGTTTTPGLDPAAPGGTATGSPGTGMGGDSSGGPPR